VRVVQAESLVQVDALEGGLDGVGVQGKGEGAPRFGVAGGLEAVEVFGGGGDNLGAGDNVTCEDGLCAT
jgi:hypothetical protein